MLCNVFFTVFFYSPTAPWSGIFGVIFHIYFFLKKNVFAPFLCGTPMAERDGLKSTLASFMSVGYCVFLRHLKATAA